jgi:hypothetical protein
MTEDEILRGKYLEWLRETVALKTTCNGMIDEHRKATRDLILQVSIHDQLIAGYHEKIDRLDKSIADYRSSVATDLPEPINASEIIGT